MNNVQPERIGNQKVNVGIAVIGMLIASTGNLLTVPTPQKWCYLVGALLLLLSSSLERQRFFIILQIIVVIGSAIAFSAFAPTIKAAFPIVFSILALIYMATSGMLRDKLTIFGCFGIVFLAAGYAITNPFVYLFGALVLMIYSFISYSRGVTIALLWGILNAIFSVTAAIGVYHLLMQGS